MRSSIENPAYALMVAAVALVVVAVGMPVDPAFGQTKNLGYSSAHDWNLKAENILPRGVNPYYLPLLDGAYYVFEEPNFSDEGDEGYYRKEVRVLDEKMEFDIPSIGGKFETAIVEEKEFLDGKQFTVSHNYYAIDKITNSVYVFGETAWESSSRESADMSDTVSESWRAGWEDDYGLTEPGMLVPGALFIGQKFIIDGAEGLALVGGETVETGVSIATPAGTFDNCFRAREYDLIDIGDVTEKCYCLDVGIVSDTSDGKLVEATALKTYKPRMTSLGSPPSAAALTAATVERKISDLRAREIAVKAVPGAVMDVGVEKKLGAKRIVVEVIATEDQAETDVIIDMVTGEVLGIEK